MHQPNHFNPSPPYCFSKPPAKKGRVAYGFDATYVFSWSIGGLPYLFKYHPSKGLEHCQGHEALPIADSVAVSDLQASGIKIGIELKHLQGFHLHLI